MVDCPDLEILNILFLNLAYRMLYSKNLHLIIYYYQSKDYRVENVIMH